ncbi:uncharacterized protein LOC128671816 isoform X2 [Plodia interpunctella]|uniref:uncharacterized protein LOC128671816 isoform X2 n=1 Tax=Plodia interpunctella TaxID=58824 RepID=UPI0023680FA9|nr:uncharacterized protein LOC128671816 isoform X2 [Plodia interpunctella]
MKKAPQGSSKPGGSPFKTKVKGKGGEKKRKSSNKITVTPSLLGVLDDRDCACEVMARTVRSHTHAHLGLPLRRARQPQPDPNPNPDAEHKPE